MSGGRGFRKGASRWACAGGSTQLGGAARRAAMSGLQRHMQASRTRNDVRESALDLLTAARKHTV